MSTINKIFDIMAAVLLAIFLFSEKIILRIVFEQPISFSNWDVKNYIAVTLYVLWGVTIAIWGRHLYSFIAGAVVFTWNLVRYINAARFTTRQVMYLLTLACVLFVLITAKNKLISAIGSVVAIASSIGYAVALAKDNHKFATAFFLPKEQAKYGTVTTFCCIYIVLMITLIVAPALIGLATSGREHKD